jgi:hypothetical protein
MKILIVDDERMICEWLEYCIVDRQDFRSVGTAYNGEQALTLFYETKPDIVFTDIKMPVKNGIELLKEIKKVSPSCLVIILSAFAEFDLVREAMRYGADDYLLKTEMSKECLEQILERAKEKLGNSTKEEAGDSGGRRYALIRDVLKNTVLSEGDIQRMKDEGIRWRDEGLFAVALWKKDIKEGFTLPDADFVHHLVEFEYNNLIYMILGNLSRGISEGKKEKFTYEYARRLSEENCCMVGISTAIDRLVNVADTVTEAVYSLGLWYYKEKIKVYTPERPAKEIRELTEKNKIVFRQKIRQLYTLSRREFKESLEMEMEEAAKGNVYTQDEFSSFCCQAAEMAYMRFAGNDLKLVHCMLHDEQSKIKNTNMFSEVKEIVDNFVNYIYDELDYDKKKISKGVEQAVEYIKKHYSEAISLDEVAKSVNLNPEYLSRVFREETGSNYSAYLTDVRLKQAAYLLSNTLLRVQRIAEEVGYPNVSYFSTIFKKKYGINPYEFRRRE